MNRTTRRATCRPTRRPMLDTLEARQHLTRSQIVGYLQSDRIGTTIDVSKIDWSAITQLNYFTLLPSSSGAMPTSGQALADLDPVVAAAHAHGVKLVITIGGAYQDGDLETLISDFAAGNQNAYNALATSLNTFQNTHHIDGVDFDWEPLNPTFNQITNYGKLIQTIQANTNMSVSAAVNPELLPIRNVTDGGSSARYVLTPLAVANIDLIGVMAYDLDTAQHSQWDRSTRDLDDWSTYVTGLGQSKEKLLFGLPFYGRAGTSWGTNPQSYNDIVKKWTADQLAEHPGTTPVLPPDQDYLWAGFPDAFPQGETWYFNSRTLINNKTGYALDHQVGGVMIWDLAQDYFDSNLNYTNDSLLPGIRATTDARSSITATGSFAPAAAKQTVKMTFSTGINAATLGPADLILVNRTTGATIDTASLATVSYDTASKTASWSFNARLPDGNYRATLRGGAARDASGNPLAADTTADFFVLAGDANRDRVVNFADLVLLAQNYNGTGKTNAQGDFNYDGKVDFADLVILAQNYNKPLAAPTSIVLAATAKTSAATKTRVATGVLA